MTSDNGSGFYWVRVAMPVEVLDEIYRQGGTSWDQTYGRRGMRPGMYGQNRTSAGAIVAATRSGQTGYGGDGGQMSQSSGPQTAWGAYAPPAQQWESQQIRHMTPEEIERYVNLSLDQNPRTTNADINATVNNGTVILSGRTRSKQAKRDAERIAWSTPDVQDVENNIMVLGRSAAT